VTTLSEKKREIAEACKELVEVYLHNEGQAFSKSAPVDLLSRRAELLSVIELKTNAYASEGGIVLNFTFDLPTAEQVNSGAWGGLIKRVKGILDAKGLFGNYEEILFNEEKGLSSLFFDEKSRKALADELKGDQSFGSVKLMQISNEAPVFSEFNLAYLGYKTPMGLLEARVKIEHYLSK
jgi:hypothetical protein